ncbi:MAG: CRISPR system precrRNA processing endoribonuclease RAMP protein Cas6 [Halothiobacillaceae bacterium]|nr:CRISPR system precrRNA processing endoribonuclease RAMP protein Cas6 [Halothiobacillaceae bacterium]
MDAPLYLARLRVVLRSHGFELAGPRGNAFHGGLGLCLKALAPEVFDRCFAPQQDASWPRPYVLLPPLESRSLFMPGDSLNLELTLFNEAIADWPAFIAALAELGHRGVGQARGRYGLSAVWHVTPEQDELLWLPEHGPLPVLPGLELAAFHAPDRRVDRLRVEFITPLRLKARGDYQREAPSAFLLAERTLTRLSQLTQTPLPPPLRESLAACPVQLVQSQLQWQDTPRWSSRQQHVMPFGGLLGEVEYAGELSTLYPWLHLAQWLHLGGKTTFGLGALRVQVV